MKLQTQAYPASNIKSFPLAVWINKHYNHIGLKVEEGFSVEPDPRDKLKG